MPVDIIHLKIAEHKMWGQMPELTATIAQRARAGRTCRPTSIPIAPARTILSSIIPPWAHEGGAQAMIGRLQDPALRPRLENEINHGIPGTNWYDHYTATGGWDGMLLVSLSNPKYKQFEGKRMSEVIRAMGKPGIDVLFELLINNSGSVPDRLFPPLRRRHAVRAEAAVGLDRLGRHGGDHGRAAGGRAIRIRATSAPFRACWAATCATRR